MAPTNKAGAKEYIDSVLANPNKIVHTKPKINGINTPPNATKIEGLREDKNFCLFVSIPTSNRRKTAPNWARKKISFETGKLFWDEKIGPISRKVIPPIANGDISIPAINSPKTWGIFKNLIAISPPTFAATKIIHNWSINSATWNKGESCNLVF